VDLKKLAAYTTANKISPLIPITPLNRMIDTKVGTIDLKLSGWRFSVKEETCNSLEAYVQDELVGG